MTKRLYHILTLLTCVPALALLMFSCTSRTIDSPYEEEEETIDERDAVTLKVILRCSDALKGGDNISSAAAAASDDKETGTNDETKITKAVLYLYHSDSKSLYKQTPLKTTKTYTNQAGDVCYDTDSIKIETGIYDIFVIANCDKAPSDITQEDIFLHSVETVSGPVTDLEKNGYIVMSNRANSNKSTEFKYSKESHTVNIDLERVFSKATVSRDSSEYTLTSPEGNKYATIIIAGIKVLNTPKEYYFFRHTAKLSSLTEPEAGYDYFSLTDDDENNVYVIDPGFFKKNLSNLDSAYIDDYYADWYKNTNTETTTFLYPTVANFYFPENPIYKDSQKKAFVTGLLFNAAVRPVSVSYYDAKDKLQEDYDKDSWQVKTLYLYDFRFFRSAKDINKYAGKTLLDETRQSFTDKELSKVRVKQVIKGIGDYETKYIYWIRHNDNENEDVTINKEFSILRNNYYKLNIKKVTGIGFTEIDPAAFSDSVEPNKYTDLKGQ